MSASSDGWDDMRGEQPLDDPFLGDLLDELRSWGTRPAPEPSAALATLLNADSDPVPSPPRRKKSMLVTKLAGLGVAAKAALGLGVAAAAVTTAGATGVLPDSAQHGVATVVNAVSPLQIPDPTVEARVDVSVPTTGVTLPGLDGTAGENEADDEAGDEAGAPKDNDARQNHGACVSDVARNTDLRGREHGQAVSAAARSDCGKGGGDSLTSASSSTSTTVTTRAGDETGDANRGPSANSGRGSGNSGNSGNSGTGSGSGNSGTGSGSGNSGSGNSGSGNGNSGRK